MKSREQKNCARGTNRSAIFSGVGLLVMAIFFLPSLAGAQIPPPPGVFCDENLQVGLFVTQCVAPDPVLAGFANCAASCAAFCPGYGVPPAGACWCTLDDAVNAPAAPWEPLAPPFPHPPQPTRVIGVFGPTDERAANKQAPGNVFDNVVITRGLAGALIPFRNPTITSPLVIEECHNAKIGGAGLNPALPVIDIPNVDGGLPVGPVLINSVEASGGAVGIRVGTSIFPTTLKAIRAENNGIGIDVTGNNNIINGTNGANFNGTGIRLSGNNNIVRNTNRALNNDFDGFLILGNRNQVRGNIAESNGLAGFAVFGFNNVLRDNRAKDNFNGFAIPGFRNTLQQNKAEENSNNGFLVSGIGNRLRSNSAQDNGGNEYQVGANNVDQGGNKCNGDPFTFDATGGICP